MLMHPTTWPNIGRPSYSQFESIQVNVKRKMSNLSIKMKDETESSLKQLIQLGIEDSKYRFEAEEALMSIDSTTAM